MPFYKINFEKNRRVIVNMRQRKKKIRQFLIIKEPHYIGKGVQYIYQFPNGMGASVVKFEIWRGRAMDRTK